MDNIQYFKGAIDATSCVSNGWNLIKPNYWMYFGISILAMLLISCVPCVNVFLLGPVMAGVYYVLLRDMRHEPVDFGMMFKGFEKFVPAMVVGLIQSIPGIIFQGVQYTVDIGRLIGQGGVGSSSGDFYQSDTAGIALAGGLAAFWIIFVVGFLLLSIAWQITFIFAIPILIENDIGPMEAIKLSAKAGWSNAGGLILLMILQMLIGIAGVLALCIGILFVIPIMYAANAFAYRQVFPMLGPPVRTGPPPPEAYGFGQAQ